MMRVIMQNQEVITQKKIKWIDFFGFFSDDCDITKNPKIASSYFDE